MVKRSEGWRFAFVMPTEGEPGPWIGVRATEVGVATYPMQVQLRFTDKEGLVCAGLRIGEGAGQWSAEPVNITSTLLGRLPLGKMLQFLQELDDPRFLKPFTIGLPESADVRTLTPGAKRKDEFYIQQAERFATAWRMTATRTAGPETRPAWPMLAWRRKPAGLRSR